MRERSATPASWIGAWCALLLFVCAGALALEVPPPPTQWFTDRAGVVTLTEASMLNTKLSSFEQQTGAQFIIYVFESLENEAIEDFTVRAVERWKVGQRKYDNGLVLFVFVKERKVRIETGYGLEGSITDAFASRVIREQLAPHFQRNAYAAGLNAAADALMQKIRTGEEPVAPLQRRGAQQRGAPRDDISPFTLIVILFVIFFVLAPMFSGRRRRAGGCNGCFVPVFFFPGGGGGMTFGGGGFGGGFGGGGGFSGGGGRFGGGGATGGW